MEAKAALRKAALKEADKDGWLYVPFCGFGECTDATGYPTERIVACDIDRDAGSDWQKRRPAARVEVSDATAFAGWPANGQIVYADLDAYGSPWLALHHLMTVGPVADVVQVILTDGSDETRARSKRPYNFQTHKFEAMASRSAQRQRENLADDVIPWLATIGWQAEIRKELRGGKFMRYWWLTLRGTGRVGVAANQAFAGGPVRHLDTVSLDLKREQMEATRVRKRLAELQLRERAGELTPVDGVLRMTTAIAVSIRRASERLTRELRRQCDERAVAIGDDTFRQLLNDVEHAIRSVDSGEETKAVTDEDPEIADRVAH